MMETLNHRFGPYPYPTFSFVEEPIGAGGVEFPNIVWITPRKSLTARRLEYLFAHELAHNWFQGMVGSNETYRAWMDEGLTQFYTADTYQYIDGPIALEPKSKSNYVNRFNLEGRSYQVIPQVPRGQRLSPEALGQYYLPTSTGQQMPLSTVVSIETGTDPNALTHYNQLNSATFQAVPMPGVTVGQAVDFLEGEAKKMPAGFSHDYLADSRQYVQEGNQLAITFGFALIIIFLVLAAQFESLRDPLVIMISVPMAIVGALIPLFFGMATMNIYTQVGLLTLVGLISKHGILMVEFANELQLNEGLDRRSAIEMAARVRLRPILMTTAAMVTGLLPLLTATGAGAASRFSIGLVVVAGMSIGTLFTLFVLPAVYVAIATDHRAKAGSERAREIADFDDLGRALKPT